MSGTYLLRALIAVLAVAALALAWWLDRLGIPSGVLVGVGIGVAAGLKPTTRRALTGPIMGLALALVPLLLPFYVVLALSTHDLPLVVQVALGAAVVPIYLLVRKAEGAAYLSPLQQLGGLVEDRRLVLQLVAAALAVVAAFWQALGRLGGTLSALALLAALIWLVALVLRVFSYAQSTARSVLAAAVGLLILRAFVQAGLAPGESVVGRFRLLDLDALLILVGVVLGAVALYELWLARNQPDAGQMPTLQESRPSGGTTSRRAAAAGFAAAVVSGVVLATATLLAALSAARPDEPATQRAAQAEASPPPISMLDNSQALADMYAPVFALTEEERWEPERVDEFVTDAWLFGGGKTERDRVAGPAALPKSCPAGQPSPCYTLTLDCLNGDDACTEPLPPRSHGLQSRGAVYARVVRPGTQPDGTRDPFLDPTPYGDELIAFVQYWIFYRYDEWVVSTAAGRLIQRHEGDWEWVGVGLGDRGPLFVAYSSHCGGSLHEWDEVEVVRAVRRGSEWDFDLRAFASHPLVAVAEGSHANYLENWGGQTPDWLACRPQIPAEVEATSYLWNLRERTRDERRVVPAEVIVVHGRDQPMAFPGYWGLHDSIVLRNFRTHEFQVGRSPASPRFKRSWTHPFDLIFCSEAWGNEPCGERTS